MLVSKNAIYSPMWLFVSYTLGTFAIFLAGPTAQRVPDFGKLTSFVIGLVLAFGAGFVVSNVTYRNKNRRSNMESKDTFKRDQRLIIVASFWYLLFSIYSMNSLGYTSVSSLLSAIQNPRESYYTKFEIGSDGEQASLLFQLLNLFGIFYFLLIPLIVFHWKQLRLPLRVLALLSIVAYLAYYLAIGTQKGLGDVAILLVSTTLAVSVVRRRRKSKNPWALFFAVISALLVAGIVGFGIVSSLGARVDTTSEAFRQIGFTEMADVLTPEVGPDLARGAAVAVGYPTHGYLGLAYALELPFEWTGGLGAHTALSSYLPQYFGLPDPYERTYPVRSEQAYGWSSTEYWSTSYSWLASDFSFPGVILFMFILGFIMLRIWRDFLNRGSSFALVLIGMFGIWAAYSPANNQLSIGRYSAIGSLSVIVIYLLMRISDRRRSKVSVAFSKASDA